VETPLILIFTPTSWLIPRPTYVNFRKIFDTYFQYETGFIVHAKEFFKLPSGGFPIAFTIWSYRRNENGNKNKAVLRDLTNLQHDDLAINWNQGVGNLETALKGIIKGAKNICLDDSRGTIKDNIPKLLDKTGTLVRQTRYDFTRSPSDKELKSGEIYGGLPIKDPRRSNKKTYGNSEGKFVGFMDDSTPVRVKMDTANRMSRLPDRVWFRLDTAFRVDKAQHNEDINDKIIAEMRRSKFMVSDFTGHRLGVYFEAGFMLGLGRGVIFTCKEGEIGQAHFDTSHRNHVIWKDAADLREKLKTRIQGTIPS
jgi:hypothetical protein